MRACAPKRARCACGANPSPNPIPNPDPCSPDPTPTEVRVWRNAAAAFDFRASARGPGVPVGLLSVLARDGETQARKRQEHRQVKGAKLERKKAQKAQRSARE